MKRIIKIVSIAVFILMSGALISTLSAQPDPGYYGSGNPVGEPPIGGGAPLGSGIILLVSIAIGYGARKVYNARKDLS